MTEPLPRHQGAPSGQDGSGASQGPEPDGAAAPGGGRRIIGTPGDDVLDGTRRVETLDGRAGNDSLNGGGGADTLIGGDGDDVLWDVFGANRQLGGDGDDAFRSVAYGTDVDTLTGGAGRDTYYLVNFTGESPTIIADVITDFEAGPGGDVLDLDRLLAPPEDAAGPAGAPAAAAWNPFTEGFLRLVQDGDDTLLQIYPELWFTVVVLKDTAPENLVAGNFSPPYDLGAQVRTLVGTDRGDVLDGTVHRDVIEALEGDDVARGGAGGDTIQGDGGDDRVEGAAGDDILYGGGDQFDPEAGQDTLEGGGGADHLYDGNGADVVNGGRGIDRFWETTSDTHRDTLTGGPGRDVYHLRLTSVADAITDFETGPQGDLLDLDELLSEFSLYGRDVNPFTSGHLRVVQDGADALLQVDVDGGGNGWETLLELENTAAAELAPGNFSPPFGPFGPGGTIRLTERDDPWYLGTDEAERIEALGGNDQVEALGGDDTVDGGAGSDQLYGGPGSDVLNGGRGNDTLAWIGDDAGRDTLTGGPGRDRFGVTGFYEDSPDAIPADRVTDFEAGPDGDLLDIDLVLRENPFGTGHLRLRQDGGDTLLQVNEDGKGGDWRTLATLEGTAPGEFTRENFSPDFDPSGAGRPIDGTQGPDRLTGGADHDRIAALAGGDRLLGLDGNDNLDGGDGADTLDGGRNDDVLIGGEGADWADYSGEDDAEDKIHGTVVDLAAGAATDGWNDGDRLSGIENVVGSRWHDDLAGDAGDNALVGLADEDRLSGREGDDTLSGGDGVDILDGGTGADRMDGGAGVDRLIGGPGADRLAGGWAADKFIFRNLSDLGVGPGERDVIRDFAQADGDRIVLRAIDADQASAGNQAFAFVGTDAFIGVGQIRFVQQAAGNRTLVEGNVDGDLAADFRIGLVGLHDLSDRDLVL